MKKVPFNSPNKPIWTHVRRGGLVRKSERIERKKHSGSPDTSNLLIVKISGVEYLVFLTQVHDSNS